MKQRSWILGMLAALLLALCLPAGVAQGAAQWRFDGVSRIVAFGDVHGAYDELFALLRAVEVIDASGDWSGGNTHLVSLGDLVDRGSRSRDVLDLLMRLEEQAAAAGGRFHLVLGNHDAMNITGELDFVSDDEFAAFAPEASEERRAAEYARWLERTGQIDRESSRAAFDEIFPAGFFAHRDAFSPEGTYGAWLIDKPLIITINDTVFVHAGLSPMIGKRGAEAINRSAGDEMRAYLALFTNLEEAGVIGPETPFNDRLDAVRSAGRSEQAEQMEALLSGPVFDADGPLWYRGTAWCHPLTEVLHLQPELDGLGASRVVVGHTPTRDKRLHTRITGRAVMIDTGMLASVYGGRPAALVIEGGAISGVDPAMAGPVTVTELPRRVGSRPGGITDDQLEDLLANGEIIAIEDVGQGVTKPQKVTIRDGENEVNALFKTESTPLEASNRRQLHRLVANSDRWQYEVAAYRLDRMLGLDLVPVTVVRDINGRQGALQFWVENLISELERQDDKVAATGWCPLSEQYNLMVAFDTLIFNVDRTLQNIVYDRDTWMLYLIDHSRGFRLDRGVPKDIRKVDLTMSEDLVSAMEALTLEDLRAEMGDLLLREQLQALLRRRDELVKDWRGRN